MGVPRVYCSCEVCMEARTGGRNRRYRSSALLSSSEGELLIDCGPEWRTQMEHYEKRKLGHVLITHAHFDHIAGLPEWADACRWQQQSGHVYAPADVLATLRKMFPWLENQLVYHDCSSGLQWGAWQIQPWKVFHGKNGYSYAYRFDKLADNIKLAKDSRPYRFAYCPDAINLSAEQQAPLFGLDLLVIGTNFYKEEADFETRSVYDMVEALELLAHVQPKLTLFTHMSHGVDITKNYNLPAGVNPAQTGMQLELG
ncbi:MBL fold metallo-hydrolase [Paenibacillus agricola]|uniref:MBL fold metallo-hydrolase n=1 Tax=Paenibacillus agricola TaxID=2716264 RepID=A0ABX0J959_9BACL|nr:MBL fold metallo-hydrolase [Paenibacillus agricola]NHN31846.1 MBL fold metallo-hydrolase [Paenibacillus agricola]